MSSVAKTEADNCLAMKLLAVSEAVSGVGKAGRNEQQGYDYVLAADVIRKIRTELFSRKLLVTKSIVPDSLKHFTETNGKSFVTTVEADYTFHDVEHEEQIVLRWIEAGADIGGEKGLYKAFTGGLKYFLQQQFLIPSGEDPEADSATETETENVLQRPAVPTIPRDRATAIFRKARDAGLVPSEDPVELSAVLIAKLADVGVDTGKIGHLNVDQAEAVEAWLENETTTGVGVNA